MKKYFFFALLMSVMMSCNSKTSDYKNTYNVVPLPSELKELPNQFELTSNTNIVAPEEFKAAVTTLNDEVSKKLNFSIPFADTEGKSSIVIAKSNTLKAEGYTLNIAENKINIEASNAAGVFYAMQTLKQLIHFESEGALIPCADIKDEPRFSYRGMHRDVARHFISANEVKKFIDYMAMNKLNTLHWHLTDDQGWRVEIKKYPKLTEIGAWRKGTLIGRAATYKSVDDYKYDTIKHGGYYTQEQIKDVVAYAKERFITVIPEMDLPGHTNAVLAAYPELACKPGNYEVSKKWGVSKDVILPNAKAVTFFENILDELMEMFDSKYIHLGGDECPKDRWKESAECQALIRKYNLKNENELQNHFMNQLENYLHDHGREMIGWDEVLDGKVRPTTTVMYWRSWIKDIFPKALENGNDIILTPVSNSYYDYYQSRNSEEPTAWGSYIPLQKAYGIKDVVASVPENAKHKIIGVQANTWAEYMKDFGDVEYAVLPRMSAVAEVGWSKEKDLNFESFNKRLASLYSMYAEEGANYRVADVLCKDIEMTIADTLYTNKKSVDLMPYDPSTMEIRYTTDGTIPTMESPLCPASVATNEGDILNVTLFANKYPSKVGSSKEHIRTYHIKYTEDPELLKMKK